MNQKIIRRLLTVLLAAIFVVSGVWAGKILLENRSDTKLYEEAQDEFVTILQRPASQDTQSSEENPDGNLTMPDILNTTDEMEGSQSGPEGSGGAEVVYATEISVNFDALAAANEDIIGWIWVPGTIINYPILQGANNDQYLRTAYTGDYARAGSIFMDYRSHSDMSDRNTVIYGHNMNNGSMFGSLKKWRSSASYCASNPYFYVIMPDGERKYEIFCVTVTESTSWVYTREFSSDESYQNYLNNLLYYSVHDFGVMVTTGDDVVTLSTCTSTNKSERLIMVGKLVSIDDVPYVRGGAGDDGTEEDAQQEDGGADTDGAALVEPVGGSAGQQPDENGSAMPEDADGALVSGDDGTSPERTDQNDTGSSGETPPDDGAG